MNWVGADNWVEKYLREGHTVAEIAAGCGVSLKTVYRWRDGVTPHGGRFGAIEAMMFPKKIQEIIPNIFDPTL